MRKLYLTISVLVMGLTNAQGAVPERVLSSMWSGEDVRYASQLVYGPDWNLVRVFDCEEWASFEASSAVLTTSESGIYVFEKDAEGRAVKCVGSEGDRYTFEYDVEGRLMRMSWSDVHYPDEVEYTDITWKDGCITRVQWSGDYYEEEEEYVVFEYGDGSCDNVGGLMAYDELFAIDLDQIGPAAYVGLLGAAPAKLPSRQTWNDGWYQTYDWTADGAGYPVMCRWTELSSYAAPARRHGSRRCVTVAEQVATGVSYCSWTWTAAPGYSAQGKSGEVTVSWEAVESAEAYAVTLRDSEGVEVGSQTVGAKEAKGRSGDSFSATFTDLSEETAYFYTICAYADAAQTEAINVVAGEVTTAPAGVAAVTATPEVTAKRVFDLQGREVTGKAITPGVYVVGDCKELVR